MQVGNIYVNRNMIGAVVGVQPFGGHGLSGTGPKAGGPHYLARFATEQTVTINTAAAGGNAALLSGGEYVASLSPTWVKCAVRSDRSAAIIRHRNKTNKRHGSDATMENGIFEGLKVLDCASFIAAPAAATVLSDFGADVIKIEPPGTGDPYRNLPNLPGYPAQRAQFRVDAGSPQQEEPRARPLQAGRRRRCCIGSPPRPTSSSPIFRRRCASRLGITYDHLAPLNERLIYASFTGYGEKGEEANKPGFDSNAYWARSGLMDLVRADENTTPARSIAGMGDHPCAMAFYGAIVTALYKRERTGKGSHVSSNLMANGVWAASRAGAGQTMSAPNSASGGRASAR